MPRYCYSCEECEEYQEVTHGMKEVVDLECSTCGEALVKVPSIPLDVKIKERQKRVGDEVNSFIEESRENLKEQRKEMENKR